MINKIRTLVDNLNYYGKLYDEGIPILSDKEYDEKYFELYNLEQETGIFLPDSPTQTLIYTSVNKLNKVKHNHPMLSLQKTQSIDEINNFIGNKDYIIMHKIDGLTCSLGYKDGKLISAETRGDGIEGEDVLHNALVIKNIPKRIPYKGKLTVDGEIICKLNDFEKFAQEFKNARNFAAGSIRLLDAKECATRDLSFIAWDLINFTEETKLNNKLSFLLDQGFEITDFCTISKFNEQTIELLKKSAKEQYIPIDGLVIKYNDCEYYEALGHTDHHYRGGIAFKFYDETYETKLLNIEWSMGRTGQITPVAIVEPVEIDGSTVSRCSLHNLTIIEELLGTPYVGQNVKIYKAKQIIPQIDSAIKDSPIGAQYFLMPETCPICGANTAIKADNDSKFLICTNDACEGKFINQLEHFCGKKGLDIKGLSKATLGKLIEWEWIKTYEDIFNLYTHKLEWINKPGFGAKSVGNILDAIEQSKTCSLDKFITALGIPLIGTRAAKDLQNHFISWDNFITAVENRFNFFELNNFGTEMHNSIISFDYSQAKYLVDNYLKILINEVSTEVNEQVLKDKIFVITGKLKKYSNRDALKAVIEELGGKVASSVSSRTSYLINNDTTSGSSKNLTAQKLNIPIISEDTFIEMFGILS